MSTSFGQRPLADKDFEARGALLESLLSDAGKREKVAAIKDASALADSLSFGELRLIKKQLLQVQTTLLYVAVLSRIMPFIATAMAQSPGEQLDTSMLPPFLSARREPTAPQRFIAGFTRLVRDATQEADALLGHDIRAELDGAVTRVQDLLSTSSLDMLLNSPCIRDSISARVKTHCSQFGIKGIGEVTGTVGGEILNAIGNIQNQGIQNLHRAAFVFATSPIPAQEIPISNALDPNVNLRPILTTFIATSELELRSDTAWMQTLIGRARSHGDAAFLETKLSMPFVTVSAFGNARDSTARRSRRRTTCPATQLFDGSEHLLHLGGYEAKIRELVKILGPSPLGRNRVCAAHIQAVTAAAIVRAAFGSFAELAHDLSGTSREGLDQFLSDVR